MKIIHGKSKSDKKVSGVISFYRRETFVPLAEHRDNPLAEYERFMQARDVAADELDMLFCIAAEKVSASAASIFEIQKMMIEDKDFNKLVSGIIKSQKCNAEFAVKCASKIFYDLLRTSGSEYMRQRAEDIFYTSDRILRKLYGHDKCFKQYTQDVIVCVDTISSSDVLLMHSPFICALAMKKEAELSHGAIIAEELGIPIISGLGNELDERFEGKQALVECSKGELIIA